MKAELSADGGSATLRLETADRVRELVAEADRQGGLFLELDRPLRQFDRLKLELTAPPDLRFEIDAEVMQMFPKGASFGTAVELRGFSTVKRAELRRLLDGGRQQDGGGDVSPIFRIRKMNPTQRFRLATKASRTERQILIRDSSPQVLMGLLSHPQIEDGEILEIIKSSYASGGILKRVADNRKWMNNPEIHATVVRNPKTPTPIAIKLLDGLRTSDLRILAKSSAAREALRKAALRVYLKRTSRRG